MRRPRSIPALLVLALFAAFLVESLPPALDFAEEQIKLARRHRHETSLQERQRFWGANYTARIEQIRRAIPEDGVYLMVNGDPVDQGAPIWVRFDLAPRRALLLGRDEIRNPKQLRKRIPRRARWVVIAYNEHVPELIEKSRFLRRLEENL